MFEIFPGVWLFHVIHKSTCTYCRTSPCPEKRRSRGHIWPPRLDFCSDSAPVKQRESQETEAAGLKPRPHQAALLCLFHFYSHLSSSLRVHRHESLQGELAMRWLGSSPPHLPILLQTGKNGLWCRLGYTLALKDVHWSGVMSSCDRASSR